MEVRSLRRSISVSLLIHALFALVCFYLLSHSPKFVAPPKWTYLEVNPPAKTLPKKDAKKADEDESVRRQIVQTADGQKVEKAKKDAFLGEKNQVVDLETVGKRHETVMGHTAAPAKPTVKTSTEKKAAVAEVKPEPVSAGKELSRFGLPILPKLEPKKDGQQAEEESKPDAPQWAEQGSTPEDYVKGVKEGDRTALNTKEFVFYGYYQRIRSRLDRAWVPILREKLVRFYRSGRQLASDMDHTTRILVVLNDQGEIVRVQIQKESGTEDLDEAAVKAFNSAGPFPNPPRGIIDANREIQIPWEFILKT
jgi:protein TonB